MFEKIPESPLDSKEIITVNLNKNQPSIFTGNWNSSILVTWCKQLSHWKSPWCWERWSTEGEEGFREWKYLRFIIITNLDSILKSRDITWPTKVHLVKAMVFPVVMYGCESWTVKKAEWSVMYKLTFCNWRNQRYQ